MRLIVTYISNIINGMLSLLKGMRVTGYYFVHPGQIVTQRYPENRDNLEMFERFKGEVVMPHEDDNTHKCTGCGICEINCPNGSIEIITKNEINAEGKSVKTIDKHIYHLSMCTFCGLCVKTCPSNALAFSNEFEHAVFDRNNLTKVLNKPGSLLKKTPKE
jgi:NADH-quinone oxidoreductase subunit I